MSHLVSSKPEKKKDTQELNAQKNLSESQSHSAETGVEHEEEIKSVSSPKADSFIIQCNVRLCLLKNVEITKTLQPTCTSLYRLV